MTRTHRIKIDPIRRREPDLKKLAHALLLLASRLDEADGSTTALNSQEPNLTPVTRPKASPPPKEAA